MREIENEGPAGAGRDRPPTGEPEPAEPPQAPKRSKSPETDREPVPGIEHEPEPDGENIVPARHRPGTL